MSDDHSDRPWDALRELHGPRVTWAEVCDLLDEHGLLGPWRSPPAPQGGLFSSVGTSVLRCAGAGVYSQEQMQALFGLLVTILDTIETRSEWSEEVVRKAAEGRE